MDTKGTLLEGFGGKDRRLWYNMKSWRLIGERLGIKVRLSHFQEDLLDTALPVEAVTVLVWAGLLHEEPDLTEDQVEEWLDEDNVVAVTTSFFSRFAGMSPEKAKAVAETLGVEVPIAAPELDVTGT